MQGDNVAGQETIKVLIVEDHAVVLWGLNNLIDGEAPAMHVVGNARNRRDALSTARSTRPDVILLDLTLGDESALDFLPQLAEAAVGGRVLVLTGIRDQEIHRSAIRRGASGVVCKDEPAELVLKAVRKVYEGEVWFDRQAAFGLVAEMMRDGRKDDAQAERLASLTPKEREIIAVISSDEDSTNRQVARRLGISENTLRNHLSSIYDKLGVANRLELLKFAISQKLA